MIFKTQRQLFVKAYCKHFRDDNAANAQNFFKIYILGQLSLIEWAQYLFVKDIQ